MGHSDIILPRPGGPGDRDITIPIGTFTTDWDDMHGYLVGDVTVGVSSPADFAEDVVLHLQPLLGTRDCVTTGTEMEIPDPARVSYDVTLYSRILGLWWTGCCRASCAGCYATPVRCWQIIAGSRYIVCYLYVWLSGPLVGTPEFCSSVILWCKLNMLPVL